MTLAAVFRGSHPLVFVILGLMLISAAAFVIALPFGLFTAGGSAFFYEWRSGAERRR